MEHRSLRPAAWAGAVLVVCAVHLAVPAESTAGRVTYAVTMAASAVAAWLGTRRTPPGRRWAPGLVASGLTAYVVGDLIWFALLRTQGEVADASWADVAYFASYLGLGAAVLVSSVPRLRKARYAEVEGLLDLLTAVTVSLLVFWTLSISERVADFGGGVGEALALSAAPVGGALLAAALVRGLVDRQVRTVFGPWFAVGALAWLGADVATLITPGPSAVLDLGWMLGAALIAASTWRDRDPLTRRAAPREGYAARLAVAVVPMMVPPLLDGVHHLRADEATSPAPFIGYAVLMALVVVRLARLLSSEARSQQVTRRSKRYFARLSDTSSDAVVVLDAAGNPRSRNPRRSVGAEQRLHPWFEMLAEADTTRLLELWPEVLKVPERTFVSEVEIAEPDGRRLWLSARMVNLLDDPDVSGVVVALSDITDRKAVEAALAQARDEALAGSRAKSAFLATISHEIRTPMNGVIGLTELLLTTELDERQRQYAGGVRTAGDALLAIINDVLDFSKVEAGHVELEDLEFDVLELVEKTAELVSDPARRQGLELVTSCAPDLPLTLRGDPARLRQVLLNLATNAVKFTHRGEVLVAARLDAPAGCAAGERVKVRFEVADTGIGLEPEARSRLFEAFVQADATTTRRYGGTGLGLAISRELVTAMGGKIGVDSAPGEGSTFWFTVPLVVGAGGALPPAPAGLDGVRVLVADDNPTTRLVLGEQLAAWGMRVDTVPDGPAALERLTRAARADDPFEVALLDLAMPGIDGLDLARLISHDPDLGSPRLVLLAPGDEGGAGTGPGDGIEAVLTKPVPRHRLQETLVGIVGADRVDRAPREPAPVSTGPRGHVLVVEDSEINQLVAVGILEHLGFTAEVAEDGEQALAALEARRFDAVLMDCQMPVLDGYAATRELRRREAGGARVPVIAMTASAIEGDRERCLEAGMDDYLSKPVAPGDVGAALARWVSAATR